MSINTEAPPQTRHRGLVLATMCVGMFLVQLDVTVVNIALPQMRISLSATLEQQQWIVDGYAVLLASLLLVAGDAGDRFGHRRVVITGLGVFGGASVLCAAAPAIEIALAGRAIQGIGAALLLPSTLAIITHVFPNSAERAKAVGVWAGVSALALPAGPLLGGILVVALGWQTIFWINIPIVALALPATLWLVAKPTESANRRRPDLAGAVLAAITLATLVYTVITVGNAGMGTEAWISAGVSVTALAGFLVRETSANAPMLPLSLLRVPAFAGANLVAATMNLVGIGTIFVVTLYLQNVQHHSPLAAGALMLPLFAPMAALAPITGRLTARCGARLPMAAGLSLGAAGSFALTRVTPASPYFALLPVLVGLGIGMGLMTAAVVAVAIGAAPANRAGLASGINNAARQAAGAVGIALYGAIAGTPEQAAVFTDHLHTIGLFACALWIGGVAVTWLTVAPAEPAATTE